jgi:DNA modification methylase
MTEIQKLIKMIKDKLPLDIPNETLISLTLDVTRVLDKKVTNFINIVKQKENIALNSHQKNNVRRYYLKLEKNPFNEVFKGYEFEITHEEMIISLRTIIEGISLNESSVIGTIVSRYSELKSNEVQSIDGHPYFEILKNLESNKNQLLTLHIKPQQLNINELENLIFNCIENEYGNLSNYHSIAIIFENENNSEIQWSTIYRTALFCENFLVEKDFKLFNRKRKDRIDELSNFIHHNKNIEDKTSVINKVVDFYSAVSYGFQFQDLLIREDGEVKILIMQKVKLDETKYPCPDCMKLDVSGNSYPKLLLRSFECQNPHCPSRSKIGRGKRYDLLTVKRNLMLQVHKKQDLIDFSTFKSFRRDIFSTDSDYLKMIFKYFSWHNSNILYVSNFDNKISKDYERKIVLKKLSDYAFEKAENVYDSLKIVELLRVINKSVKIDHQDAAKIDIFENGRYKILNGDSAQIIEKDKYEFSGVVTSPPYYNAREYSNWPNFVCYLVDMMINARSVFQCMKPNAKYLYNIGDIVGQNNIYVESNMSKGRLMLGFYSAAIFEMVGYNIIGNYIWDKGEVQSKRNSTENLLPGYVKPINCYEHILIFDKENSTLVKNTKIKKIDSVKKINSKGENLLGHTAPYPEELVKILFPFLTERNGFVFDPFLGSGTTLIACYKAGIKCIGAELNQEYFDLSGKRFKSEIAVFARKQVSIDEI